MERDDILQELRKLKPLNLDQIGRIRETATQDVYVRIGPEPQMKTYLVNINLLRLLEPLDYLLIVFFLSLMAISVLHIMTFGSHLVAATTLAVDAEAVRQIGIVISREVIAWVTQIGLLVMAETGSLGFAIRNAKRNLDRDRRTESTGSLRQRYVHFDFFASLLCAGLAITFNVHAMTYVNYASVVAQDQFFYAMGWLIGIFIPTLVIYLGDHFAGMFLRLDTSRQEALELYYVDIHNWREWRQNPDTYDLDDGVNSYRVFFSQRLVEYYKQNIAPRLKDGDGNKIEVSWTPEVERYLAARERVNMRKMDDIQEIEDFFAEGEAQSPSVESENSPQPSTS